jgi:hypothetical protein
LFYIPYQVVRILKPGAEPEESSVEHDLVFVVTEGNRVLFSFSAALENRLKLNFPRDSFSP